jgi:hypothetical protein
MDQHEIIQLPIEQLGVSSSFVTRSRQMHYQTLGDIFDTSPEVLISKKGFSYAWLGELTDFLNKRHLLHLLQAIPGKTAY